MFRCNIPRKTLDSRQSNNNCPSLEKSALIYKFWFIFFSYFQRGESNYTMFLLNSFFVGVVTLCPFLSIFFLLLNLFPKSTQDCDSIILAPQTSSLKWLVKHCNHFKMSHIICSMIKLSFKCSNCPKPLKTVTIKPIKLRIT